MIRQGSEDSDNVEMEYCGKLHFALKFDSEMDALFVKVLEARDLPIKDVTGSSDPYVKVYLLPDRKKKFQTKVHRKNLNPVFNETFIFSVTYEELRTRYLQFSVYDFDRFSRHDLIGQVVLKGLLDSTDLLQEIESVFGTVAMFHLAVDHQRRTLNYDRSARSRSVFVLRIDESWCVTILVARDGEPGGVPSSGGKGDKHLLVSILLGALVVSRSRHFVYTASTVYSLTILYFRALHFGVRLTAKWQWPGQGIEQAGECRAVVGILGGGRHYSGGGVFTASGVSTLLVYFKQCGWAQEVHIHTDFSHKDWIIKDKLPPR
ncbi:Synaptotagmin-9 [Homalodisca vitripennis]|nr:Synaptotagmin-9 [Homalodisca vitripennis]